MSLLLNLGTVPEGTTAKTDFSGRRIYIGELTITMEDFCHLVIYGLTNTDLNPDDPRLRLLKQLADLQVVEGYNQWDKGAIRLGFPA